VLARYGPKGKRYDTIDITQNIAMRYDTMHKRNVKFNARASVRQCTSAARLRAWPVQQDDDRSETANTGTCADDVKRSDDRQCRLATTQYRHRRQWRHCRGDRQVVSCKRSRMIDVVSSSTQPRREQRSQHLARFRLDRADQQRGDEW